MELNTIKTNKDGLDFIVISKNVEKSTQKHIYYNIRFVNSGYETYARTESINKGTVKDKLSKTLCGVGIVGYVNTREHFHEYKIWADMIYRCYCKTDKSYKFYGEKGVVVCDRWHRFDYFLEDIPNIKGFNKTLFDEHKLKLDKDILSDNDNKIYSLETTTWVEDIVNQEQRALEYNLKNKKFAIFPDGHIEQILHVTNFCKQHGLHRQNVNLCLSGKQKSTKGFKFYKE